MLLSPYLQADSKILIFGDSLSAGYGLQQGESWVDLLSAQLQKAQLSYEIVNASISGDTTANGLQRLPHSLKQNKPDIVILELGANDGLRGFSMKNMKKNLEDMIKLCRKYNSKVLLVGMQLPPNYGAFYIKQFNNIYKDLAKEKNIPLLPFLFAGFEKDFNYFQADKIHPNAKAQNQILQNVWQALEPLL
ncbi:MAG: arylesterase [Gammaproteobacteria bacterium]|nr:arylesterase [Gammaproteobacteria bacterium]